MATPNIYRLKTPQGVSPEVCIDFATAAGGGIPGLRYEYEGLTRTFAKDEVRVTECDLGLLVSVTLNKTADAGSVTFSLLVPAVNLAPTNEATIHTYGMRTLHRFSPIPAFNEGQVESYAIVPLEGSAIFRAF
jgi:hypothetical protein